MLLMTSRTALPALARFTRPSDDLEAQASLEAELEEAHKAASLLAECDPFVRAATLLGAVSIALGKGEEAWALLDAAERVICDLRLEHGGEDWDAVRDWTQALCDVALLDSTCRDLRMQARQQREERLAQRAYRLRIAG